MGEQQETDLERIGIIGAGNIGCAIADGLAGSGLVNPEKIFLTRRHPEALAAYREQGFHVTASNEKAVSASTLLLLCVEPHQMDSVITELDPLLDAERHLLVSVASGVSLEAIRGNLSKPVPVVRAMPNTAIAIRESMTCLSSGESEPGALSRARQLFDALGSTLVISEELMTPATALCACGVAFFLRAIRAASQGGIETGIGADQALTMAAQTAKGAAALLLEHGTHPEAEIDRVTTPRGCTIAGLNQMEHKGFSSAMIQGISVSAKAAEGLH